MVRAIMDANYEKCPYCESERFKGDKDRRVGFAEFIEGVSFATEAIMRFCPICGKQFFSLEEWEDLEMTLFNKEKQEDEYIIWDTGATNDIIKEINNKKLSEYYEEK